MEVSLGSYYSTNGMALAISILRFPEDYKNRPKIRTRALRYLFSHGRQYGPSAPNRETLSQAGMSMFNEFTQTNNIEGMREIADILTQYTHEHNLLDRIRELDDNQQEIIQNTVRNRVNNRQINHEDIQQPQRQILNTVTKSVYSDSQNVHNSKINQSVIKCLENLFSKYQHLIILEEMDGKITNNKQKFDHKKCILDDIRRSFILKHPDKTELVNSSIDYIKTSTAIFGKAELGIIDAFVALWFWIQEHKHQEELEKRLLEELKEMNGYCSTGHIARLMNVMQGFTDDENLSMRISNHDQCSAVVKQYLTKVLQECKDEDVISEMVDGGEKYIRFIRKSVAEKLLEWQNSYGKEMLKDIVKIVNDFSNTTVFKI